MNRRNALRIMTAAGVPLAVAASYFGVKQAEALRLGTAADKLDFVATSIPSAPTSADTIRLYAENLAGFPFLSFVDTSGMVRKFVRDSVIIGYNNTGVSIPAFRAVYASGSSGTYPTIALAKADAAGTMPSIGITLEAIADTAHGRIMQVGLLDNINSSGFAAGDVLYVSPATAGLATNVKPTAPNIPQEIGTVLVSDPATGSMQCVARSMLTTTPHASTHISAGTDPFLSTHLLEAIVKRLQESGGPTTLTLGAVVDGEYLKRNGVTIDSGTPAGGGTLDQAYDSGGAGAGREITVDSSPVKLTTPNTDVLELGDADEEGGDIAVYRDATGIKAFDLDADANPVLTLRSAAHNDILRITDGAGSGNIGVSVFTGHGANKFLKIGGIGQAKIGIGATSYKIIIFSDAGETNRILIAPDKRLIYGDSAVMGFSVETTQPTLGTLGTIVTPCKTTAGAMTDALGGNRDGAIGGNSNDSTLEIRLGGSWLSVAVAGYLIPKKEKTCSVCKKEMKVGQFVAGYRDKDYSDGRGHWLACHFKCALRESEKEVID